MQDAKDEAERLQKQIDDAAAEAAREMASTTAEALRTSITAMQLANEGTAAAAAAPALVAGSDGTLTATQRRLTQDDDFAEADAIDGFRGVRLTGSEMVAYTNIENAEAMTLASQYNAMASSGEPTSYPVAGTEEGNIAWNETTRDDSAQMSVTEDDVTTVSFAGMVGNVAGRFSCPEGTTCVAPLRSSDGTVDASAAAGTWSFIPTDPNAMIDVADSDYLVFGWWLDEDADDMPSEVDVFVAFPGYVDTPRTDAAGTDDDQTLDEIEGIATYSGGAAGKYALHNLGAGNSESGNFTASASLTADFDANAASTDPESPDENGVMITGMIDDFMTGDMARSWTVELMMGDANTAVDGDQALNTLNAAAAAGDGSLGGALAASRTADTADDILTTEWDLGGNVNGAGAWTVSTWGADEDAAPDSNYPLAAVGEFNASLGTVGSIVGAFGVTLDE